MVGGLVEHQQRRLAQQEFCEGHAHLPAAGELRARARHVRGFEPEPHQDALNARAQFRLLRVFEPPLDFPDLRNGVGVLGRRRVGGADYRVGLRDFFPHAHNALKGGFRLVVKRPRTRHERLLRQVSDGRVPGLCDFARVGAFDSRENFQKGSLARAVGADKAYLVALVDDGGNIVEYGARPECQPQFSKLYHESARILAAARGGRKTIRTTKTESGRVLKPKTAGIGFRENRGAPAGA